MGRADETIVSGGITHLAEHLTLWPLGQLPFRHNGTVTANLTAFVAEGTPQQTNEFLRDVARWLSEPHLDRLEIESRILESEAAMSSGGPFVPAMRLRFGPVGYGLAGYDQYGLRRLGEEEVAAWIRDRFTSANAAIWMTGPVNDLDVALPDGRRVPPPPLNPLAIDWPVHSAIGDRSVALHFLLRRTPPHTIALAILAKRAERRLRYERGVSYSVAGMYEALTADEAHALLMADSRPGTAPSVSDDLLALLDDLGREGPTEQEVSEEAARYEDAGESDSVAALGAAARDVLLDTPVLWMNDLAKAIASVTREAVASAARSMWERMLVLGAPTSRHEIDAYPEGRGQVIEGETFRAAGETPAGQRLIVGKTGVSLVEPDGLRSTVRFDSCVAAVWSIHANRTLLAEDGTVISVTSAGWRDGRRALLAIDAALPPDVFLDPRHRPRLLAAPPFARLHPRPRAKFGTPSSPG
ncbi:MAG: hypothetical protein ACJ77A_02100 [Actinomycetota bacterium]